MHDEASSLIGRVIGGRYVVESFLGAGAMGAVFRARHSTLEKHVALKVLHRDVEEPERQARRFHREARAASRLDHPNSIRVIDYGQEPDGLLYMVMELVRGRTLQQVIHEEGPLPPERAVRILGQALHVLDAAHEEGLVHRDLKPDNIMVIPEVDDETSDLVKVCDFGVVKVVRRAGGGAAPLSQHSSTDGVLVGTPEFMSPEQCRGEPVDARSDIYAAGAVLYHMLTGAPPFRASTALGVVVQHLTEQPPPIPNVDARLEAVCLRALEKRPQDRFGSAREMRHALRRIYGTSSPSLVGTAASSEPPGDRAEGDVAPASLVPVKHDHRASKLLLLLAASMALAAFAISPTSHRARFAITAARGSTVGQMASHGPAPRTLSVNGGVVPDRCRSKERPRKQGDPAARRSFVLSFR
jgi:serine/threonine-protein kinase